MARFAPVVVVSLEVEVEVDGPAVAFRLESPSFRFACVCDILVYVVMSLVSSLSLYFSKLSH